MDNDGEWKMSTEYTNYYIAGHFITGQSLGATILDNIVIGLQIYADLVCIHMLE